MIFYDTEEILKLIEEHRYKAYVPHLKRTIHLIKTPQVIIAKKIKLFKKLKYFPQKETFKYCQSQIEGRKKCKTQCNHCKQYYKTLENANIH